MLFLVSCFIAYSVLNGKIFVSQKKPRMKATTPTMAPILAISFVSTKPVDDAIALGGVEIGNSIAIEAQTAMNEIIACVPPRAANTSALGAPGILIASAITIKIGMSRAAVAELLMKFDRK